MIPTSIRRYTHVWVPSPMGYLDIEEEVFSRPINIQGREIVRCYAWPHIAVRWSPWRTAIERLLDRAREIK